MKERLKVLLAKLANTRPVRSTVVHLIYPNIVRALRAECLSDVSSPSGIAEQFAWKSHAYQVLYSELAAGVNCCPERMDSTWESRERIFEVILRRIEGVPGDILEFGVSSGQSFLWFLKRCPDRHIYGFDSFEGLPEDWWTRPKGSFKAEPPRFSEPNGTLVRGWFEDSMPRFFANYHGPAALIHVDCDLMRPSIYSLTHAIPRCREGTIILFDEYYNYPEFAQHEWLAWRQIQATYELQAECVAYDGRRAAFQIKQIGSSKIDGLTRGALYKTAAGGSLQT